MTFRVLFVTSEFEDYVRVGGLASVSAALPRAMKSRVDVRLLLPGYRGVLSKVQPIEMVGRCAALGEMPACSIGRTSTSDGLPVYVAICPELYDRDGTPYADEAGRDWCDNDLRFARLSSAAAFLAAGQIDPHWCADILHANDWPSAMAPAYLAWNKLRIATILTIHNLAYQGLFPRETLHRIGAPDAAFTIDGVEFYNKVSFLKSGLVYADHLTTVSATYAREITTPQFGCRLEGLLQKRAQADQLTGILNGIDETWDPRNCPDLETPFGAGDWQHKRANANHIRRQFNLALSRGPLFGLVARLVHQKGVDMVLDAAETIVAAGGQIVVLGRGDPHFEHALQQAQARRPESIGVAIRFQDAEARRIFAGSDFTLMPSRFEPCGLSQMYAQRFGSLPIGHKTGGLADTIDDGRTGFLFEQPSTQSFLGAICRAFGTFGQRRRFNDMRSDAMATSFAWGPSVETYHGVYSRLAATS
jgi:starch synthase